MVKFNVLYRPTQCTTAQQKKESQTAMLALAYSTFNGHRQ